MSVSETVQVHGWFEPRRLRIRIGEPVTIELTVRNEGERDAFVFVPRGRADGLEIRVLEGGDYEISGLEDEPEPGPVAENRLRPEETYRQEFPLSSWLALNEPGRYVLECRIRIEAADKSIGEDERTKVPVEVASTIEIDVTEEVEP